MEEKLLGREWTTARRRRQRALRAYELQKLKYFFAIATCDSAATAAALYAAVDGVELERSATRLELSFVPRASRGRRRAALALCARRRAAAAGAAAAADAGAGDALLAGYKPPESFECSAARNARVACTWDESDDERRNALSACGGARGAKFGGALDARDVDEYGDDIAAYLAPSGSDSDSDAAPRAKSGGKAAARAARRKLLGLDVDEDDEGVEDDGEENSDKNDDENDSQEEEEDDDGEDGVRELRLCPATRARSAQRRAAARGRRRRRGDPV